MQGETESGQSGDVPLYGEGGDEAASMEKAAQNAQARGPSSAQAPGRSVAGKTETGEPAQQQAPRQTQGPADHRPSQA